MKKQVLLLHGFTGSASDMTLLSEELARKNMLVSVPPLPGHDTHVEHLETVKWEEWIQFSQRALDAFDKDAPRVIVALSMGTFIATILAANKSNQISGLVLLAPAFALQRSGRLGVILSKLGLYRLQRFFTKTNGSDIQDPQAQSENNAYDQIPLRSLVQFEEMRKVALQKLKDVTCPVFLGFGAHDHTIDNAQSVKALASLASKRVERHDYSNSAHVLTVDYDRDVLNSDVARFIESLE